jgi:hypothetical protein
MRYVRIRQASRAARVDSSLKKQSCEELGHELKNEEDLGHELTDGRRAVAFLDVVLVHKELEQALRQTASVH